jgi:hypothetical protein
MRVTRKRGDTRPIDATLKRAGKVIPLDGATVMFFMDPVEAARGSSVSASGEVLDAAKGRVRYSFAPADVEADGLHRAEFQVTFEDGVIETFPNGDDGDPYIYIEIIEDLGT